MATSQFIEFDKIKIKKANFMEQGNKNELYNGCFPKGLRYQKQNWCEKKYIYIMTAFV